MRILVLTADYPAFLDHLYAVEAGLESQSYADQQRARGRAYFGVASFYADNLRRAGHAVDIVYVNNPRLQEAWLREQGLAGDADDPRPSAAAARAALRLRQGPLGSLARLLPRELRRRVPHPLSRMEQILALQAAAFRPDVILVLDMIPVPPRFLRALRRPGLLVVGQHAATALPYPDELDAYDLIISSFPPTLDAARRRGVAAEPLSLGFDERVLEDVGVAAVREGVAFVGSFFPGIHDSRLELLEAVAADVPELQVWTPSVEQLGATSRLRSAYAGPAWGREMYAVLGRARVTLNHHGDVMPFANNCRLYEATGMGSALVTDWKPNLGELFADGEEVRSYRTPDECVAGVRALLDDPAECDQVARAGQRRTLAEHSYSSVMADFADMVEARLSVGHDVSAPGR